MINVDIKPPNLTTFSQIYTGNCFVYDCHLCLKLVSSNTLGFNAVRIGGNLSGVQYIAVDDALVRPVTVNVTAE